VVRQDATTGAGLIEAPEDTSGLAGLLTETMGVPRLPDSDRSDREQQIREIAETFGVALPDDYMLFLLDYGNLSLGQVQIVGLAPRGHALSLPRQIVLARMTKGFPIELVPVEDLGNGALACVASGSESGPVLRIDLGDPSAERATLALTFDDYVTARLAPSQSRSSQTPAFEKLVKHVERFERDFGYDHGEGGRLPKPHEWRPVRLCVQDVLLGALVFKHNRAENNLLVDVFITSELEEYEDLESARIATLFLISEAYQAGGTLEIKFEDGVTPGPIQSLAKRHGIALTRTKDGVLTPDESRRLYYCLTGFTPSVEARIEELSAVGFLTPEQAAYSIHHSIWGHHELEVVLRGADDPRSILTGASRPLDRLTYLRDVRQAAAALLSGRLLTRLRLRNPGQEEVEDDPLPVQAAFLPEQFCSAFESECDLAVPWLSWEEDVVLKVGEMLVVAPRPRTAQQIMTVWRDDLTALTSARPDGSHAQVRRCVLYPADFLSLSATAVEEISQGAVASGAHILVAPDNLLTLSRAVDMRLLSGRTARKC
jgi:hypothetical protein